MKAGHIRGKTMDKVREKLRLFLQTVADYGGCIYILLIAAVLPFYFTEGYGRIGTDKALFFRTVSRSMGELLLPVTVVLLVLALRERGSTAVRGGFSVTDGFMALYAGGVTASYFLSDYREQALLGAQGWFMGLFTQLTYVAVYFYISRLWKPRRWMLFLFFPVSFGVILLGYLDRFGLHVLNMAYRSESFISTIGNINWYCGYTVIVCFLGIVLFWRQPPEGGWQRLTAAAYVTLSFGTLLTQGSESGTLTLVAVLTVLFCLSVRDGKRMQSFWQLLLQLSAACLISTLLRRGLGIRFDGIDSKALTVSTSLWAACFLTGVSAAMLWRVTRSVRAGKYRERLFCALGIGWVIFCGGGLLLYLLLLILNTRFPGSIGVLSENPVFCFSNSWGSFRGATWRAALCCFGEQDFLHQLFGVGPDAMSAYLYRDAGESLRLLLRECFGEALLTNAHCEWLTVLVDVGVIGLSGFAGTMISAIARFVRAGRRDPWLCAIGLSLLAYTVNNLFSFQQTLNGATVFVLLGMGTAFLRAEPID